MDSADYNVDNQINEVIEILAAKTQSPKESLVELATFIYHKGKQALDNGHLIDDAYLDLLLEELSFNSKPINVFFHGENGHIRQTAMSMTVGDLLSRLNEMYRDNPEETDNINKLKKQLKNLETETTYQPNRTPDDCPWTHIKLQPISA